ncbi:MAG: DUF2225 domain-containing protein [Veillonellaceae bacterium]|jgi:uncharacterized protein (DUF2225 family)|nr:DUF2225 domain-containing protein [Veillonellaceae bacterium]
MADILYTVDKNCSVCSKDFSVTRVRTRIVKIKQDTDFCTYYKDVNPYYYTVWVCPNCGYAAQDSHFPNITAANIAKVSKFLAGREVNINLSGVRTRDQAVAAYKLAIFYAEMEGLAASDIAGLYLRLGWLFREGEFADEEQLTLAKAAQYFEQALFRERLPIAGMSEVSLTYLVGELLRRVGRNEEALRYFSKVVSNPQAKLERRILDMAREAWQASREAKKSTASNE